MSAAKKEVERVKAIYPYHAEHDYELSLMENDVIEVIDKFENETDNFYEGWWSGKLKGRIGLFPVAYTMPVYIKNLVVATSKTSQAIRVLQIQCGFIKPKTPEGENPSNGSLFLRTWNYL
jgi:hypothetical protein